MKEIKHLHLIVRAEIVKPPEHSPESEKMLNDEVRKLIEAIGMKVVLEPRAIWVGAEGNEGYTGQAGLETSHLTYHIWNKPDKNIMTFSDIVGLLQLDIYTCGCLGDEQLDIIRNWVIDIFAPLKYSYMLLNRDKKLKVVEHEA